MDTGFSFHDHMIWEKKNPIPLSHRRYEPTWEHMFVFSKGAPKTFNPIKEKCRSFGHVKDLSRYEYAGLDSHTAIRRRNTVIRVGEMKTRTNLWRYSIGGERKWKHPAKFPIQLAKDHIQSWSNEGDIVLDVCAGSGTVPAAAKMLNRHFIGIELSPAYADIARERVAEALPLQQATSTKEPDVRVLSE
jgi:site-specific DNA-methyltransferase (adenine-specific)